VTCGVDVSVAVAVAVARGAVDLRAALGGEGAKVESDGGSLSVRRFLALLFLAPLLVVVVGMFVAAVIAM